MARTKNRGYQQTLTPTYTARLWKMGGYIRLSREDLQKINRGLDSKVGGMIFKGGALVKGIKFVIGLFALLIVFPAPLLLQNVCHLVRHFNERLSVTLGVVVAVQIDDCHSNLLQMTGGTSRYSLSLPVMELIAPHLIAILNRLSYVFIPKVFEKFFGQHQ